MGRFDFAIPKSLKVRLEIPGYDAKSAAARVERRKERERLEWQQQRAPAPAAPVQAHESAPPTTVEDVIQLQASLQASSSAPEPSIALDLSDIFGGVSDKAAGKGTKA